MATLFQWEPLASHPHIQVQTMVWTDKETQHAQTVVAD